MSTLTAVVIVAVVTIIGFYVVAAYIVHETGATTGIAALGRAVERIVAAFFRFR